MALKVALVSAGVFIGVIAGAAFGIHAADESDMGGGADLTGVDGSGQGSMVSADAVPDLTVESSSAQLTHSARADCVVEHESHWNPNAVNGRSGAAGLGQFLRSTWLSTPEGAAGASVFNADANYRMVVWMLAVGRAREFEVITRGLC